MGPFRGNMHSQSPLCPNCSRPMVIARTIPGVLDEPEVNVFECSCCRVDFMTEDLCVPNIRFSMDAENRRGKFAT